MQVVGEMFHKMEIFWSIMPFLCKGCNQQHLPNVPLGTEKIFHSVESLPLSFLAVLAIMYRELPVFFVVHEISQNIF